MKRMKIKEEEKRRINLLERNLFYLREEYTTLTYFSIPYSNQNKESYSNAPAK